MSVVDELTRRRRVVDQMLSGYAILRDRYHNRAMLLDSALLVTAGFVCATTFAPSSLLWLLPVDERGAANIVGWVAVGVFVLSLVQMRIDWKQRASEYRAGAASLASVKSELRALSNSGAAPERIASVLELLAVQVDALPTIPDAEFVALKAAHLQKVELSRLLDRRPFAIRWLVGLLLVRRHTAKAVREVSSNES